MLDIDEIPSDIRYALVDIDIEYTVKQCQKTDYRILNNHPCTEFLMLFSSNFVDNNDGYYPWQLIELMSSNIQQEVMLRSIAKELPCCHILSCVRLYSNSVASHILLFYAQLSDSKLLSVLNKKLTLSPFDIPLDANEFHCLNAVSKLLQSEYDISYIYDLPVELQSYVFTWHFTNMFNNNKQYQLLLNNKLYLNLDCRRHIFGILESDPFNNRIHCLSRGYFDGERDDEDEHIMQQLLRLYNYDELIIAYQYLLNDYNSKIKRISYITLLESHLLRHIDLKVNYKLLPILMNRKPLECCSLLLPVLEWPSISAECCDTIFSMIYDLWYTLTVAIQRDIFTQFILPLLYKSYNAPFVTTNCLEVTARMTEIESFHELIRQIAFSLIPPLGKLKRIVSNTELEIANHYYDKSVGLKALKCVSKLPSKMVLEYIRKDSDLVISYMTSIEPQLTCFTLKNSSDLNHDDLLHFLGFFVELEIQELPRKDYQQHQTRYEIQAIKPLPLEIHWDGYLQSFILLSQYPCTTSQFSKFYRFSVSDIVKWSLELISFGYYCRSTTPDQVETILILLKQCCDNITSLNTKTSCGVAILGVLEGITHNPYLNILLNYDFLNTLIDIIPKLPVLPGLTYYKIFYAGIKNTPLIMHLASQVLQLLVDFPNDMEINTKNMENTAPSVTDQRQLLWSIGIERRNVEMLDTCNASSLAVLKTVVKYIVLLDEPLDLYKTDEYYEPLPGSLLSFVVQHQLIPALTTSLTIPNMKITRNVNLEFLRNQAPFNQELSSLYLNHFTEYLDYDLLLNLFGLMDYEFYSKMTRRGKKILFKPLNGLDIYALDTRSTKIDWIKFALTAKNHLKFLNSETLKYIGQYLFDKLSCCDIDRLLDIDLYGLEPFFKTCNVTNLNGEYISVLMNKDTDLQVQCSNILQRDIPVKLMLGFVKLLKRSELIDLLLYHEKPFEWIVRCVAKYERDGLNTYGLAKQGFCNLEPQRLLCIMQRYPECIDLLKNAYFQPNQTVEGVFQDLLLD
eukprot:NODE_6_length_48303_cov_0.387022.p3 type:complete len:1019 gc:universal NODE_6_length_48303_cov_0.387022:29912-26856(-)